MSNKELTDVVTLREVPIFRAGDYPQGSFGVDFLEKLADGYDPEFHEAPIYLSHEDTDGKRPAGNLSFGWIKHVYLKGRTLFANIIDVPRSFAELVLAGRVKKRSLEIYTDLAGRGPYIRALAWPMIPEVKGLANLHPSQIFNDRAKQFLTITFESKEKNMSEHNEQFMTEAECKLLLEQQKTNLHAEFRKMLTEIEVQNFCEQMVLAGKMTPAERQTEEPLLISQRQKERGEKSADSKDFSEDEKTLSQQRMEYYRNRGKIIETNSPETAHPARPEHQKLVRYFHENEKFFKRTGVSIDDLIEAEKHEEKQV